MPMIDLGNFDDDLGPGRHPALITGVERTGGVKADQLRIRLKVLRGEGHVVVDHLSLSDASRPFLTRFVRACEGPRSFDPDDANGLEEAFVGRGVAVLLAYQEAGSSAGYLEVRRYDRPTSQETATIEAAKKTPF